MTTGSPLRKALKAYAIYCFNCKVLKMFLKIVVLESLSEFPELKWIQLKSPQINTHLSIENKMRTSRNNE